MENFFDTAAKDWDMNQIHVKRTEAVAKELRNIIEFKENSKALDFGAGTGLLSFALKDLFSEIVLMDSSVEMVRVAKEKLDREKITNLIPTFFDLEKDNYTNKTFDFIFTQMAMHHVMEIDLLLSKFYALLNTGGTLAIIDLYKEDGTFHDSDFMGHFGFRPLDLSKILIKIGFVEIFHKPCYEIKKADGPHIGKAYPLFLLTAKKI